MAQHEHLVVTKLTCKIIEINGELYADYLTSGFEIGRGVSAPTLTTFRDSIQQYSWSGSALNQGFFNVHFLHDIKAGSLPTFHVHYAHNIAGGTYTPESANVKFSVAYMTAKGYKAGVYPAETVTSVVQSVGGQYVPHITPDDDMAMSPADDIEVDGMVLCRVFRDPTDPEDTFPHPVFVTGVDLHYRIGQLATVERNRPYRSAGFSVT